MPTIASLKKEVDGLKKENTAIKSRLKAVEENLNIDTTYTSSSVDTTPSKSSPTKNKEFNKTGVVLLVIGALLTWTGFFAIIGIPMVIVGIILLVKESKKQEKKTTTKASKKVKVEKAKPKESFEANLGIKWFGRIGILALVIGAGFFIKYAIENNWINHFTRILIAVLFGAALILIGHHTAKKKEMEIWGKTLAGGGIAIAYFAVYAAYHFVEYRNAIGINLGLDIVLLTILVGLAVWLSIKDESQIIAGESFFLGFVTSLLSTSFEALTLVYSLILTLGLIFVVTHKNWPVLGVGGVVAAYLVYIAGLVKGYDFGLSVFYLLAIFLAYNAQVYILHRNKVFKDQVTTVFVINTLAFFSLMYSQVDFYYSAQRGLFTFLLSIFMIFQYAYYKIDGQKILACISLYAGLLFFSLAAAVQLNKEWLTFMWALEFLFLTIAYIRTGAKEFKVGSFVLGIFITVKAFTYNLAMLASFDYTDLLASTRMWSALVTIACLYAAYVLLSKYNLSKNMKQISIVYSWAASALLVFTIMLELGTTGLTNGWIVSKWIPLLLVVVTGALVFTSRKERTELLFQGVGASIILAVYTLTVHNKLGGIALGGLNWRIISFAFVAILFFVLSKYMNKEPKRLLSVAQAFSYASTIAVALLILFELEEFWISAGWGVLALLLIMYGFAVKGKDYRIQGIILFVVTIGKVFLYDTRNLDTPYKTAAYILLGGLLLLVSYLYSKYKDKLQEIL